MSEANSHRSSSLMGKLTKVEILAVFRRASENRFRSEPATELRTNRHIRVHILYIHSNSYIISCCCGKFMLFFVNLCAELERLFAWQSDFRKDTEHQDFGEFLNGEFLCAFPPSFTPLACLCVRERDQGKTTKRQTCI